MNSRLGKGLSYLVFSRLRNGSCRRNAVLLLFFLLEAIDTSRIVIIIAAGTARINGVVTDNLTAISQQERVRIRPGKSAKLIADSGNWESQDCDNPFLVFSYNGSPLTPNLENPERSGDLFEFLGIQAAKGTNNRWVNPSGTSWLTAAARSAHTAPYNNPPSVLSDRTAPSSAIAAIAHTAQVANSWFAWMLAAGYRFRPTGILILTRGDHNGQYPRDFTIRIANGSTLTSGTAVNGWTAAQVFTNQSQIGGNSTWHFVSISTTESGRQFGFEQQQNSTSDLWLVAQEFCWFGTLFEP